MDTKLGAVYGRYADIGARDNIARRTWTVPVLPGFGFGTDEVRVPIDVIRDVLFGNDTQDATISIFQQRKEDLAQELSGNFAVGNRSRNVGCRSIVRVELRGDSLDTGWECGGGSRRYGSPPLIGDCASGEDYYIAIAPVIIYVLCVGIECTHNC